LVVLCSESHALGTELGLLSQEAVERKANGLSVGEEGHIGAVLDGRKKPPVSCTKWWYRTGTTLSQTLQDLLHLCWDFALEERADASEERLNLNNVIAEEARRLILLMNNIELRNVVWSSSTNPATGKVDTIIVRAEATISNPVSKESVELEGVAVLSPETGLKGKISLREVLERGREAMLEPTEDVPESEEARPIQTCSDTNIVWKGA